MAPAIINMTFNVLAEHDGYAAAVAELRRHLASHPIPENVEGRPVLAVQTGNNTPPARWVHVHVLGKEGAAPTVAIRDDNAYLLGFTNKEGRWFQLGGRGDTMLIEGSTLVGFNSSYQSLVGGSGNLPALKLGKYNLAEAAKVLWEHTQRVHGDGDDGGDGDDLDLVLDDDLMARPTMTLKVALASLVVALCEGARFMPVYDGLNAGWSVNQPGSITKVHVDYVNSWEAVSTALLGWKKFGNKYKWPKKLSDIGIAGKDAALGIVYLVPNKPPPKVVQKTISVVSAAAAAPRQLIGRFIHCLVVLWSLLTGKGKKDD